MNTKTQRDEVIGAVIDTIVEAVNLHHLEKASIHGETILAQGGLGLDSVDILEVVVAIEHKFGARIKNPEEGKRHFGTIGSIADFVISSKNSFETLAVKSPELSSGPFGPRNTPA